MNSSIYAERLEELKTIDNVTVEEVFELTAEVIATLAEVEKQSGPFPDLAFVGDEGIK